MIWFFVEKLRRQNFLAFSYSAVRWKLCVRVLYYYYVYTQRCDEIVSWKKQLRVILNRDYKCTLLCGFIGFVTYNIQVNYIIILIYTYSRNMLYFIRFCRFYYFTLFSNYFFNKRIFTICASAQWANKIIFFLHILYTIKINNDIVRRGVFFLMSIRCKQFSF